MPRSQATNRKRIANMSQALTFNGSERVVLTTMGTLGSSLIGAFSFGCWMKTTSMLTTSQHLFGCSQSAGGNFAFVGITRLSTRVGKLQLNLRDAAGLVLAVEALGQPVNTGRWTHVVITKDATNTPGGCKIYINGVSQTLTTISNTGYAGPVNFDRLMAIGSSLGASAVANGWVGGISQPHFYQSELTQTQVTNWFNERTAPSGAFASYLNTEGSGTAVADAQGSNNGTLTSATQWSTDTAYKSRTQRTL